MSGQTIEPTFTVRNIFLWKKCAYSRIDQKVPQKKLEFIEKKLWISKILKIIENFVKLGYAKSKGARNGSDAGKL